jgi:hypothetical protein
MVNPKSLLNLRPRERTYERRERVQIYVSPICKAWLKKNHNASLKINLILDCFSLLVGLVENVKSEQVGYRANNFTQGLKDLEKVREIVEKII